MRRTDWGRSAKTRRANRRTAEMVRAEDHRDIGIRPGVAALFGFGDPRGWPGTSEYFRWAAHGWLSRG